MKINYSLLGVGSVALAVSLVWGCEDDEGSASDGNTAGIPAIGAAGTTAGPGTGTAGTGGTGSTAVAGAANSAGTANTGGTTDEGVNDGNIPILDGGVVNNPDACPAAAPDDGDVCDAPDNFLACAYDTQNCLCFTGGGPGGGMFAATDGGVPVWNCGAFGGGLFGGGMMGGGN